MKSLARTPLALLGACAASAFAGATAAHADAASCVALEGSTAFADTRIEIAEWIEAGAMGGPAADAPAFCEINAIISPVEDSRIGAVYRLPENWNGKLLGLGGGGWSGNVSIQAAADGLSRGYATLQTDTGHPVPEGFAAFADDWVLDEDNQPRWVALEDFAHRGLHLMTVIGKQVADSYYGRPHEAAYYQGCSTGGRQGLMEAQRYPDDYVGIVAGAPVLNMTVQSSHMVRSNLFSQDPRRALTPQLLSIVGAAAMTACDADDGVQDGVISDPFACAFDPASLACPADGTGDDCLSPEQIWAVQTMYEGVKTPDGILVAHPALPGSESSWSEADGRGTAFEVAQPGSVAVFTDRYGYDARAAAPEEIAERVLGSRFGDMQDADDPDIAAFLENGGRLIVHHGLLDTIANPTGAILWYDSMVQAAGDGARDQARLFLMPGMGHCAGGPGANSADFLTALETWVEQGRAPDTILATHIAQPLPPGAPQSAPPAAPVALTRPLCPYPQQAAYDGAGDINAAESFSCR